MAVQWEQIAFANKTASKTTAAWSKSIGSGGDYTTWAAMIADMPDLIAHEVTVTIKAGTTLTETCDLKNKHGLTSDASITIQAEKYFPTSGVIPTADSVTATTLRDAALATAALGNDYFNGCWVFIVDGTGTDNGFVSITDYIDATGDIIVASWPGTQPDATSRYLIVGALFDGENTRRNFYFAFNSLSVRLNGVGFSNGSSSGIVQSSSYTYFDFVGIYGCNNSALNVLACLDVRCRNCGIVKNNTTSGGNHAGITVNFCNYLDVVGCGLSDNNQRGILGRFSSLIYSGTNFGDGNGTWGLYVKEGAQAMCVSTECSGSSGNHSDPGTAGTASADQASAY